MLDPNLKDTIAKAYAKLGDISYSIALNMKKGKDSSISQRKLYDQGIKMRMILRVLLRQITFDSVTNAPTLYRLTEEQVNKFLRCLIQLGELNKYPVVPSLVPNTQPIVIASIKGDQGDKGDKGDQGLTGLATDFSLVGANTTEIVNTFLLTDAKAARWDYFAISNTGKQRAGSIIGQWIADGSGVELFDTGTDDLGGSTDGLEFDLNISSGYVQLIASISLDTWTIIGSRYFIPNNGNGSGPITNVLPHGDIYIGNSLDKAQARTISGVVTISDTGVVSFVNGSVDDAAISNTAAISLSKLASLNNDIVVITNGSGVLSNSTLDPVTLGYVDISSSLTALLATKLTDPMTTIGDILIRNSSNISARLAIGSVNQVLTVIGGVPVWATPAGGISGLTTGYLPKASSSTTLSNSIISESIGAILIAGTLDVQGGIKEENGKFLLKKVILINGWSADTVSTRTVPHGLSNYKKIRSVNVIIKDDTDTIYSPIDFLDTAIANISPSGGWYIDGSNITLMRTSGGRFDHAAYSNSFINRGWVTIEYEV